MMRKWANIAASVSTAVFCTVAFDAIPAPAISAAAVPRPLTVPVSRTDYGINVFSYDSQMNSPSTVTGITRLGVGMQQFPNANEWSWTSNTFRDGGVAPVSLRDWGHILKATNNQGLFIFNYDENPSFTGGGTPADAAQLTQYIVKNHLPISAIVIGSEEYGAWDHYANLNPSFSAQYYAAQAAKIAQAIHGIDPFMKVGISFDLGQEPRDLHWDQTVLRVDAPYINFVSIHDYPNAQPLSNAKLLAALPVEIAQAMSFVKNEIAVNVPARRAENIQIWVTEFNPYGQPGPQSTQPIYGAAMVESAMLWRAYGAAKLFIWSYDGQAHSPARSWPVDTSPNTPYGLFALAGDGQAPELPRNQLYPSGQSLAQYLWAIGSGGTLSVWMTRHEVIGQVQSSAGTHVFAINTTNNTQTVALSASRLILPAASMQSTPDQVVNAFALTQLPPPAAVTPESGYQAGIPTITGPLTGFPGETVTIQGAGFGADGPTSAVIISQSGTNYGGPGDSYGIIIKSWSPTSITFVVPNGRSGPSLSPGSATVRVETADQLVSNVVSLTVAPPPVLPVSIAPESVYPGATLNITGSDFGNSPGRGYVLISQNGVNYGGPTDAYKVTIDEWTNRVVQVQVPDGTSGPALVPGTASMTIVNASGISSQPRVLTITPPPTLSASLSSATVYPGQVVTISGTDFGATQGSGYVLIQQNGVNYGAPSDWYGVSIVNWNSSRVSFRVPASGMSATGHDEPALQPGTATVTVVTASGVQSQPLQFKVR